MTDHKVHIGRLLAANAFRITAATRPDCIGQVRLGALTWARVAPGLEAFGLVTDIRIVEDGIARQMAAVAAVDNAVLSDAQGRLGNPAEVDIALVGRREAEGGIAHLLPGQSPVSLEEINLCDMVETKAFLEPGLAYLRFLLSQREDLALGDILANHLAETARRLGNTGDAWLEGARKYLVNALRSDYETLMAVLTALSGMSGGQSDH
jgi:hypothetical protein